MTLLPAHGKLMFVNTEVSLISMCSASSKVFSMFEPQTVLRKLLYVNDACERIDDTQTCEWITETNTGEDAASTELICESVGCVWDTTIVSSAKCRGTNNCKEILIQNVCERFTRPFSP